VRDFADADGDADAAGLVFRNAMRARGGTAMVAGGEYYLCGCLLVARRVGGG